MKRRSTTLVVLIVVIAAAVLWFAQRQWALDSRATSGEGGRDLQAAGPEPLGPATAGAASIDVRPHKLPRIEAGTVIGDGQPSSGSRLVLQAVPRVAEGDADQVSPLVARLASLFHLTVVAQVAERPGMQPARYELKQVAIGLGMTIADKERIVSSETQESLGAKLGFMERSSLKENEASLDQARQVARTPTMVVFDADAVMWLDGEHRPAVQRHAVLVSPRDGRVTALVWLLEPGADGGYRLSGDSLKWLPESLHEDRALHVDADKFVLGVPTKEAFALVRLPQGKEVPWSPALRKYAPSQFRTWQDAIELERALREIIGWPTKDVEASQ